ncbi:MAG: response regulator [Spirochaetales bacterium]|jgi:signal transduction histidine kinase/DNA-binding response OmpR family regulator/HPt (histidine-containing phosphotransfer) domain-containing protein|nr:response regulator [Spirochaetales bacterium]
MKLKTVFRKNCSSFIFVIAAFIIMIAVSFLSRRDITIRHLKNSAEESLRTVEANLKVSLHEPEATLAGSVFTVRDLIVRKEASQEDILHYLTRLTEWLMKNEERVSGLTGIYGFIRGEYLDGSGWVPPPDYVPAQRPWYREAQESGGEIAVTEPYIDVHTGEVVISYAQEIFTASGEEASGKKNASETNASLGVIALDFTLSRVCKYIESLQQSYGGHGVLLSNSLHIVAYPDAGFLGKSVGEISPQFAELAGELQSSGDVSARIITGAEDRQMIVFFRRIFNGWYVGMFIPTENFYADMHRVDLIMLILGIILMGMLAYMLLRLAVAKLQSEEESMHKSSFLARMSHDIRTPMNAIIGMGELALREESVPKMAEYVQGIKQAGHNLLSLINDILDFSKIEAGNLQINSAPYSLASLLNDVVTVIQMRIREKPVLFTLNVDSGIPAFLSGDELRLRQILLNLLSNAAKYTEKGFINLAVTSSSAPADDSASGGIVLTFAVEDSGMGIKSADLPGLFGNFVRLDREKNKNVEGTGLGLAITKSLCLAMGGDVTVSSEYGKGSVFTAAVRQKVVSPEVFASVQNAEEKAVLLYEERTPVAWSLRRSLENLEVPVTLAADADDFFAKLGTLPFSFTSSRFYSEAAALIQEKSLPTSLVLLAEPGECEFPDAPSLVLPGYASTIAAVLNGKKTVQSGAQEKREARFIAPEAQILVVDDIAVNLKVAEGLMAPYRMNIHTSQGGREAIKLIKANSYDIIFMDHMMPDMDGIEATQAIRSLDAARFREVPIIALTANAVSGMKEMFLKKGFTDYLSKPIEISRLDEVLGKWLPPGKKKTFRPAEAAPKTEEQPVFEKLIASSPASGAGEDAPKPETAYQPCSPSPAAGIPSAFTGSIMESAAVFAQDTESPGREESPLPSKIFKQGRAQEKHSGWEHFRTHLTSSLFFISALLVLVISVFVTISMNKTIKMVESATQNHLASAAQAAADFLTIEELDQFHTDEDMQKPAWNEIKERLIDFSEKHKVLYVYYWRDYGDGRIQYIIDNDSDPEEMAKPSMFFDHDSDEVSAVVVPTVLSGKSWAFNLGDYTESWDSVISSLVPVFNKDGSVYCVAGVDLSDEIIVTQRETMDNLRTVLVIALGLSFLSGSLGMLFYRKKALQSAAASIAKSQFLSTMSHEIRTPMNAIIGMSELALRAETLPRVAEYVTGIKQAGVTLLALINDILDFSKIEAGKLEILPTPYKLTSLVNDVVSIIRMRIAEKPLRFFLNIDPSLPEGLVGDEVRMRQILLNLLTNAVKYTAKGFIGLSITQDRKPENGKTRLKIEISDSGIGIKPEDVSKLFNEFMRVDLRTNWNIEGTGLGLSITKRLCVSMGGDLTVSSVYGEGSVFIASVPQLIDSEKPFAEVDKPEEKPVLVYERRTVYANSLSWSLEKLKVPHTCVSDEKAFAGALAERNWFYVLAGYNLYSCTQPHIEAQHKKPNLALLVEKGTETSVPQSRFLLFPVSTLTLAAALNNAEGANTSSEDTEDTTGVQFIAPSARLLIVDDIDINLQVAEGLLLPYMAAIDTCLSGTEALELVKKRQYDIVFMDHMMPGMDGIETTAAIRALGGSFLDLPIIALTANAVSGMREMFLENGFSDYLSKPIEITQLDELMAKWIPRGKRSSVDAANELSGESKGKKDGKSPAEQRGAGTLKAEESPPAIAGVDSSRGISLTGGTLGGYKQILAMFRKDVDERLPILTAPPEEENLLRFVTQVHALKSAAASIGAAEISAQAAALESAGKASDMNTLREKLPAFTRNLSELAENIRLALNQEPAGETAPQGQMDSRIPAAAEKFKPLFKELTAALENQNTQAVERILTELENQPLPQTLKETLEEISGDVLMADYDAARKKVVSLFESTDRENPEGRPDNNG